jgi:hypothetical protein
MYGSIPINWNPRFVGNSALLAELEAKFSPNGCFMKKAAVTGLGSIGKTQIAIELA